MSLPEQERLCRAFADTNDMTVIETLSIHGHSRSETDIFTLFEDYSAIGVLAYHKLRQHWIAGDFDVLVCVAPHRLGRSSSIVTFILENVIKRGRRAYFIQGGWVDESNADFGHSENPVVFADSDQMKGKRVQRW